MQSLDGFNGRAASQGTATWLDVASSIAAAATCPKTAGGVAAEKAAADEKAAAEKAAAEKAAAAAAQPRRKKGTRPRTKPATYKATTSAACGVAARGTSIQEEAAAAAAKG